MLTPIAVFGDRYRYRVWYGLSREIFQISGANKIAAKNTTRSCLTMLVIGV
jgi:hypothetical protein